MALVKRQVHLPFSGGLDEKAHKFLVEPGALLSLRNCIREKAGSVEPRTGYRKLGVGVYGLPNDTVVKGHGVMVLDDHLLQVGGISNFPGGLAKPRELLTWSEPINKWKRIAQIGRTKVDSREVLPAATRSVSDADCVTDGNYTLYCWQETDGDIEIVVNDSNGNAVAAQTFAVTNTTTKPRCVRNGSLLGAIWANGANLTGASFDSSAVTPDVTGIGNISTDLHTNKVFDAIWDKVHSKALLTYVRDDAGTARVKVGHLSSAWALTGAVEFTDGTPTEIAIERQPVASPGSIAVVYKNATGVRGQSFTDAANETITALAGPVTISADAGTHLTLCWEPRINIQFQVFWRMTEGSISPGNDLVKTNTFDPTIAAIGTVTVLKRGVRILGRPLVRYPTTFGDPQASTEKGQIVLPVMRDSTLQGTGFLVDVDNGRIVSKFMLGQCQFPSSRAANVSPVSNAGAETSWTSFVMAVRRKMFVRPNIVKGGLIWASKGYNGIGHVAIETDSRLYPAAKFSRSLVIAGDMIMVYDGKNLHELPFHIGPENTDAVAAAGGSLAAGTYQYTVTYEYRDASGLLWRSAPMPPKSIAVAVNEKFTVTIETLRVTDIPGDVAIVLWRTEANGSVLYRIGEVDDAPVASPAVNKPAFNSTSSASVTIETTESDGAITNNELLYTLGGVLDNIGPPAARCIAVWRDRIILGGLEGAPSRLAYSKRFSEGLGVEFSDVQTIELANQGGQATGSEEIAGLGVLDENLIPLTETQVFAMFGEGPDSRGLGPSFQGPAAVDTASGCRDPRSVVRMPQGLFYQSMRGLFMLDRGLRVSYVGAPIETTIGSGLVVGSAVIPAQNRCIVRTAAGGFAWDWAFGQWSVFDDLGGGAATPVGAAVWKSAEVMLNSDGIAWVADSTLTQDDGVDYTWQVRPAWFNLAGLLGFQRIYWAAVIGEKLANFTLSVGVAYDYEDADADTYTVDLTSLATPLHERIRLRRQRCAAIRFTLSGTKKAVLAGLSLEVGVKRGLTKLSAARTMG